MEDQVSKTADQLAAAVTGGGVDLGTTFDPFKSTEPSSGTPVQKVKKEEEGGIE